LLGTVVIGAINWDINLFIKRFPKRGEEVPVGKLTRVPGGKGANVAVAAARVLGPSKVGILGALGKDDIAEKQVQIFQQEGVVASGLKFSPDAESGQAYILIDERGENMIHSHRGANSLILPEDLEEHTRSQLISDSSIITIMDPPFETSVKLAREAKRLGKIVAWDPGFYAEFGMKVRPLLENVDYLAANESETRNLTSMKTSVGAARVLLRVNPKLKVITKLGSKGSILYQGAERTVCPAFDLGPHGLRVVNTVGCGDAFLGAFVAALAEGRSDQEALTWANVAAGLKATRPETRGSPTRETLFRYLS
jgi:ribokinase